VKSINKSVQKFYNEAGKYFSKTRQRKLGEDANWKELKPYLKKLKSGMKVLDLGCGNGRLLTGIKTEVNYLGIDFSKTLLSEAKKLHPNYKFIQGNIVDDQLWQEIGETKFDAIFCVATLHHLSDKKQHLKVLREIEKHLKNNGFAYISVWNLWQKKYLKYHLDLKTKIRNPRWVYIPFMKRWRRFCFTFDKAYLVSLINQTNLKIKKVFYADKVGQKTSWWQGRNLVIVVTK